MLEHDPRHDALLCVSNLTPAHKAGLQANPGLQQGQP